MILNDKNISSVCDKPIYIDAREVKSKKIWTASKSHLIHQIQSNDEWAYGLSKDFG